MALHLIPHDINIAFVKWRRIYFIFSMILFVLAVGAGVTRGLNFGIDFKGGILLEVRNKSGPADISKMRRTLGALNLGEVTLQEFGQPTDVLIRVERQAGGEKAQIVAIARIKTALGSNVDYRRTEFVGPQVGRELIWAGFWAMVLALLGILIYVWLRFEWQFSFAAILALSHDILLTLGFFAVLRLEFNLATVAALLTVAGYSINDTVVVFDRVRENLRKYKKMPLAELMNKSINQTLSRTVMTSVTTLLAIIALVVFGGQVIRDFSLALVWGVVIGTYSSICLAVPILLYFNLRRDGTVAQNVKDAASG